MKRQEILASYENDIDFGKNVTLTQGYIKVSLTFDELVNSSKTLILYKTKQWLALNPQVTLDKEIPFNKVKPITSVEKAKLDALLASALKVWDAIQDKNLAEQVVSSSFSSQVYSLLMEKLGNDEYEETTQEEK